MSLSPYAPISFLQRTEIFLSVEDLEPNFKRKRIILIKPKDYNCSFNKIWKTVCLIALFVGIFCAVGGFLAISQHEAYLDHTNDVITPYKALEVSKVSFFKETYKNFLTEDNMWVDHTKDTVIPRYETALKAFVPIAILPLMLTLLCWKITHTVSNYSLLQKKQRLDDLNVLLQCQKKAGNKTKLSKTCLDELIQLNFLTNKNLKNLSFSQIKHIRKTNNALFTSLYDNQKLSTSQTVYWQLLDELLNLVEDLSLALKVEVYLSLIDSEPRIIETLIQELKPDQLTDAVQDILAAIIKLFSRDLSRLEMMSDLKKIILYVNKEKCSLKKAYLYITKQYIEDCLIEFNIQDKKMTIHSGLLCPASEYFRAMLKKNTLNKIKILVIDEDQMAFQLILEYLKTEDLNVDASNCEALLDVCDKYLFIQIQELIQASMCHHIDHYLKKFCLEKLLELTNRFHLTALKNGIDEKIFADTPSFFSQDFLKKLDICIQYSLQTSYEYLLDPLWNDMGSFCKDANFPKQLLRTFKVARFPVIDYFNKFLSLLEKNPLLLKALWDEAIVMEMDIILDWINKFCENEKNMHIVFSSFKLPPVNDSIKFSRKALENLEDTELKEIV